MSNDQVYALNKITGRVGWVKRTIFEHPVLNPGVLEEVPVTQKPYLPAMFKPRTGDSAEGADESSEEAEEAEEETPTPPKKKEK